MPNGRDLIKGAFRLAGVYAPSEEPTADEINDALVSLNEMIASLALETQFPYVEENSLYYFDPPQTSYTLGPAVTDDFQITLKPDAIDYATVKMPDGADLPIEIVTDRDFSTIITKNSPSSFPLYMKVDNYPAYLELTFWPVPNDSGYGITVYYKNRFTAITLDDDILLPNGYLRMLRYNLAIEISPEYGLPVNDDVRFIARDSLAAIKRKNHVIEKIAVDPALLEPRNTFNWLTGE